MSNTHSLAEPSRNNGTKLQGKVAIITGGASGIGEATARLFANHAAAAIVIADVQDELGQAVAESIGKQRCFYVHCDVTDENQVQSAVESTVQMHGGLDVMFCCAGVASPSQQTVMDLDFPSFDRVMAVNAKGVAACVKHAARAMVSRGARGSIVCAGSVAGARGGMRWTDYHMAKHAVLGLVRAASAQLGAHGIRVNCVSPSGLATPLTAAAHGKGAEELERMYEATASLKGVALRARHVAEVVLFLACDESEFITGHDLVVDGGFVRM